MFNFCGNSLLLSTLKPCMGRFIPDLKLQFVIKITQKPYLNPKINFCSLKPDTHQHKIDCKLKKILILMQLCKNSPYLYLLYKLYPLGTKMKIYIRRVLSRNNEFGCEMKEETGFRVFRMWEDVYQEFIFKEKNKHKESDDGEEKMELKSKSTTSWQTESILFNVLSNFKIGSHHRLVVWKMQLNIKAELMKLIHHF